MVQRITDLTIAVLASIISLLLSWPYFRNFEYWPESRLMWWIYFVVGFLLAVYVFYVFINSTRTLFLHDSLEHAAAANANNADSSSNTDGGRP